MKSTESIREWHFAEHIGGRSISIFISETDDGYVLDAQVFGPSGAFRFLERKGFRDKPEQLFRDFVIWIHSNLR